MSALLRLPTLELLSLWSELEQCYHNEHGFGGDTAEIYAYRLQRHNPSRQAYRDGSSSAKAAEAEAAAEAYQILRATLDLFEEQRGCVIEVDGCQLSLWTCWDFIHRVRVRVTPNGGRK